VSVSFPFSGGCTAQHGWMDRRAIKNARERAPQKIERNNSTCNNIRYPRFIAEKRKRLAEEN
jgi:hypothetical protein